MATLDLTLDIKDRNISLNEIDKEKLSFIITRVFEEYLEDEEDKKLTQEINKSEDLKAIIANVKF